MLRDRAQQPIGGRIPRSGAIVFALTVPLSLGGCSTDLGGDSGGLEGEAPSSAADGGSVSGPADSAGGGSPGDGGAPAPPARCEHIDILFAVDASGSMSEEREAMASDIFPNFAAELQTWEGVDFRVGVNDACPDPTDFHTGGKRGECGFAGGNDWIDSSSPDLGEEFACVGDMYGEKDDEYSDYANCTGNDSDNEAPAHTLANTLEEAAAGGTNADFLRDDSLIVLVPMTDEDEDQSDHYDQTPRSLYDRIADAAGGADRVFMLPIAGASDCDGVYGGAEEAVRLKELAALFGRHGNGAFWDLCGGDLGDGLGRALELIRDACERRTGCDEFSETPPDAGCWDYPDAGTEDAGEPPLI